MILALLSGAKTQTRRLIKLTSGAAAGIEHAGPPQMGLYGAGRVTWMKPADTWTAQCPYGSTGDRLWVKETIQLASKAPSEGERDRAVYAADGALTLLDAWGWKRNVLPSIYCPRGLSRITLEIVALRVQRVQSISHEDAIAEGIVPVGIPADEYGPGRIGWMVYPDDGKSVLSVSPEREYEKLWDQINGERAAWSTNPWVWVIAFRMVKP